MSACRSCGWRLATRGRGGMCAYCRRDYVGVKRVAAPAAPERIDPPTVEPPRTAVYDGIEFDIVFDGRQSLLGDYARRRMHGAE